MGAVGGVAILGGNFEAPTFPEDKVVQRSLTAGTQESSPIDAVILDALPLGAPGQLDSHAFLWKGHSHNGSPHTIDWKAFVNVTADDGTGSLWTLQTRIDGAPYTDILTVDDNGLLTVSGATFTMDQLIIDSDNTEAVLIRKDGDAGDVFIVDTVNDAVRMASDTTLLTFGGSSDVILERVSARVLQMNSDPLADSDNELRIVARDDPGVERYLQLLANGTSQARVSALRADGGGRFDLELFTSSGNVEIWTDGVQRWNFGSLSGGFDAEIRPIITNRYDIGTTLLAVRDVFTNRVFLGQDQIAAYDAITIDGTDLAAPGQQDSGAIILTGLSNDGSPHDIDWKQFVDVTANDGTGSIFTIQARIDGASFVDEFTITATTSPTLAHIGPGSTDGALAFGPIGANGPAQSGTVRFRNTDDIRWRNSGDAGDNVWFSIGASDQLLLGESTSGPFIGVVPELRAFDSIGVTSDTGNLSMLGAGLSPIIFKADGVNQDVTIGEGVALAPSSSVDRLNIDAPNLTVNSTVGFSHTFLLVGKSREAGGVNHDSNWRMFVEPLTGTGFDGQSVFKITAEIDAGGPTTVFTLSDTGDLTVPGSFTIDGLIVDVTSTEAFLVRKNADGGDVFNVDTSGNLVQLRGGAVLEIGATPAAAGSIRLSYADSITFRNTADDGDLSIISFDDSNQMLFGEAGIPRMDINAGRLITNRIRITHTNAAAFEVNNDSNLILFRVDTSAGDLFVGQSFAPSRVVLTQPDLTGAGFEDSPSVIYEGKSFDSTPHTQQFITFVDMETNAGAGQWTLRSRFDGGGNVNLVFVTDEGRFAIAQPEQVSIGSQSFIDNVQVNITGSFIDDYGGGPTTTHKVKIQGSQTGDAGRTNRQTIFDLEGNIFTQSNSEVVNEAGGMFLTAPFLVPGSDTINIGYTLKVTNHPTNATQNYGLLVDSTSSATTLTALTRIGKSFNQGMKLLVGGGVGAENIEGTAQMRLTNFYQPDGLQTEAMLLHVHSTLQATDGTTDHITGTFFEGTLRTQVEADENVANISQVRIDEPNIQDNLTGTGEITNAQSLLITGAPTEGESNYAQRILGGDFQVAASSAILFRNNGNSGDLTALSNAPTDFLEIGGVGAGEWERVNIYSLGSIDLRPADDVTVFTDATNPFQVRSLTPNEELFRVSRTQVRAVGQLVSVANLADHLAETQMQTTFVDVATSAGSSVTAASLIPAGSFLIGITVRVISNVGGPASFDVGDGIDVDRWGASIASGIGTTTDITDFTSGAVTTFPAANDVVLTSTGVDFTAGTVRITVHYTTLQTSAA